MSVHDQRFSKDAIEYIERIATQTRGCHFADLHVRINGEWKTYEADWAGKLHKLLPLLRTMEQPRWHRWLWRFRYITWPHLRDATRFLKPVRPQPAILPEGDANCEQAAPKLKENTR